MTNQQLVQNSNGQNDFVVSRDTIVIGSALVGGILLLAVAIAVWRCRQRKRELTEDSAQGPVEVKEWLYMQHDQTKGPYTNSQMQRMWLDTVLHRGTAVKIVWWKTDFRPISEVFPQAGTEFRVPAHANGEAADGAWHRYSMLAQLPGLASIQLMWYYKDSSGKEHGPFESGKMRHWYVEGFFNEKTLLRPEGGQEVFKPLSEHFPAKSDAFTVLPQQRKSHAQMIGNAC